jgi:hypothetical protein
VQVFVDASGSAPNDPYFDYSLGFQVRATTDLLGMLDLVIEERTGTMGERIDELGPGSRYARALAALDPMQSWIAFAVDEVSVDLFRRAREQAIALGFATGFDLLSLDFPMTLPLTSGGINDLLSPIGTLDKPER